jgi:hypothetical protein
LILGKRRLAMLALAAAVTGSMVPAAARAGEPRAIAFARRVLEDPTGMARTLGNPKELRRVLRETKARVLSHPRVAGALRDSQATARHLAEKGGEHAAWLAEKSSEHATKLGHGIRSRWARTRLATHLARARAVIGKHSQHLRAQMVLSGDALEQQFPKIGVVRRHNPLSAGSFIAHKARADAKFIGGYIPISLAFTWAVVPSAMALLGAGPVGVVAGQRLSVIIDPIVLLAREHYLRNTQGGRRVKSWVAAFGPRALWSTTRDVFGRQYREHVAQVQQRNRQHAANLGIQRRQTTSPLTLGPLPVPGSP